jgi:hypothetical protein
MLALIKLDVLGGARPLPVPSVRWDRGEVVRHVLSLVKGKERGRSQPLALAIGQGPCGLDGSWLLGLCLHGCCGPHEWRINRCLEILGVS